MMFHCCVLLACSESILLIEHYQQESIQTLFLMRGVKLLVISGSTHHAGDTILAVNRHSVDLESIDIVLSGLSDEVCINTSLVPRPHKLWFVCGESLGMRLSIQFVVYMFRTDG